MTSLSTTFSEAYLSSSSPHCPHSQRRVAHNLQQMDAVEDVVIVGAGLAGLATALGLHRKGVRCLVLESSDVLRTTGFAFTTWTNAWKALDELGVGNSIRQDHYRLQRLIVSSGATTTQLSLAAQEKSREHEIRCTRRTLLLETLERELPHGSIRYSSKVVSIEESGMLKLLHLADGSTIRTKVLIGCDGINSVVAKWLGLGKPSFSGRAASRGFAEFPDGHGFKPEFLQFFGEGFRAGFLPCNEKNIYWFFTWIPSAQEKEVEENATKMKQYVLSKLSLAKVPKEVIEVVERSDMTGTVSAHLRFRSPFGLLWANISKENVCVAGDALHPMTPDIGQGGCAALEDGIVLARCLGDALLGKNNGAANEEYEQIKMGLEKYAKERRWRSFELIATALVVGHVQQGTGLVMTFLRDKCLSGIMARMLLKRAEFDCGKLI